MSLPDRQFREVKLEYFQTWHIMEKAGSGTPGNIRVTERSKFLTLMRAVLSPLEVKTPGVTYPLIRLSGPALIYPRLEFLGPEVMAAKWGDQILTLPVRPKEWHTRIPVVRGDFLRLEAQRTGVDMGKLHLALQLEFDGP